MKKAKLILATILIMLVVGNAMSQNNESIGREKITFIAYHWLYSLQSPVDPRQLFVAEIEKGKENKELIKLVYLPKASRLVDGVNYLEIIREQYTDANFVSFRHPSSEEKRYCNLYVNFLDKGNKRRDPQMMFRSFKYDSFMTFNFDEMKCFVLLPTK